MEQYTYVEIETPSGQKVLQRSDGAWVPMDEGNSDYQTYLAQQGGNA